MANLDQLKQKYQPVIDALHKEGAEIQDVSLAGEQLSLKATVPNDASKNRIWDAIKSVDPNYSDLKHDIEVSNAEQVYTVAPGDSLSKISKYFYGDAHKYMTIAKANHIDNPDLIKPGQRLVIPEAA